MSGESKKEICRSYRGAIGVLKSTLVSYQRIAEKIISGEDLYKKLDQEKEVFEVSLKAVKDNWEFSTRRQ